MHVYVCPSSNTYPNSKIMHPFLRLLLMTVTELALKLLHFSLSFCCNTFLEIKLILFKRNHTTRKDYSSTTVRPYKAPTSANVVINVT